MIKKDVLFLAINWLVLLNEFVKSLDGCSLVDPLGMIFLSLGDVIELERI